MSSAPPVDDLESYTAVVPTLGQRPTLAATITSLRHQPFPPEEIIVVLPEGVGAPQGLPTGLRYVWAPRSSSAQRNRGLQLAATPYVLLVDDDIRVRPGTPDALRHALRQRPSAVLAAANLVGDPVLPTATNLTYRLLGLGYHNPFHGTSRLRWSGHSVIRLVPRATESVGVTHLCCTLLRRSLTSVVLLDETIDGYVLGEDLDFGARARQHGQLLSVPHALADILDEPSTAPEDPRAVAVLHGHVLSYFRWRHKRPGTFGTLAWGWSHVGQLLVLVVRSVRTRDVAALNGYLTGLRSCLAQIASETRNGAVPN
ncbi:MAG: glycosyltransferase [Streptosporangiales bacterium]|nr:glycosyltransferase [Streptosporangiales bacterium]